MYLPIVCADLNPVQLDSINLLIPFSRLSHLARLERLPFSSYIPVSYLLGQTGCL
jgi:hypothetical protein